MLHAVEMVGLLGAVALTTSGSLARANPGRGTGLAALLLLLAMVPIGWQGYRLLAGRRSLDVTGLAVQSGLVMVAVAVATPNLAAGAIGIVLGCAVLAGGVVDKPGSATTDPAGVAPSPPAVEVAAAGPATQIGVSGAVLAMLTALVVLAALSVRSNIVFGLAILAVIFIPLERLFALHRRRVLRRGWRTPTWCTIWSTVPR